MSEDDEFAEIAGRFARERGEELGANLADSLAVWISENVQPALLATADYGGSRAVVFAVGKLLRATADAIEAQFPE
jgi:hypothetical protein